ncbi:MAG: dTDP-4-dehydrorhamnose reductase [Acidimicrobiales bacterium]
MRTLITGATGQVGTALAEHCTERGDEVIACNHATLDVTDRDAVLAAITSTVPDTVVHCAAWTEVDACEDEPQRALAINALGTRHVAEATRRVGAHVVYLSTDYVFDGTKATPYDEWDVPKPRSAYGRSKWAGEQELVGHPSATTLRISWVCGRHGANTVKTLLRLAADGVDPAFVTDQRGRLTIVDDLVPVLRRLAVERRPGTFHVSNPGALSWFDVAQAVFAAAGHDPARVRPITTAELDPPRRAPRPANSVLDDVALRLAGLPPLPDGRASLAALVATLAS